MEAFLTCRHGAGVTGEQRDPLSTYSVVGEEKFSSNILWTNLGSIRLWLKNAQCVDVSAEMICHQHICRNSLVQVVEDVSFISR